MAPAVGETVGGLSAGGRQSAGCGGERRQGVVARTRWNRDAADANGGGVESENPAPWGSHRESVVSFLSRAIYSWRHARRTYSCRRIHSISWKRSCSSIPFCPRNDKISEAFRF